MVKLVKVESLGIDFITTNTGEQADIAIVKEGCQPIFLNSMELADALGNDETGFFICDDEDTVVELLDPDFDQEPKKEVE